MNTGRPNLAVVTPEVVQIDFRLAELSMRLVAFVVDVAIIIFGGLAATLLLFLLFGSVFGAGGNILMAVFLLLWFLLRNFYFIYFEVRGHGRTPGKRLVGLRVIAADGGPLDPEPVFARNLTRELEVFLPLIALIAPQALVPGAPAWVVLATLAWITAVTLLPVLNRRNARLGDLVAGTVVVHEPRGALLPDLLQFRPQAADGVVDGLRFTDEQLDLYGIHELQVLEDVLRLQAEHPDQELLDTVAEKIRAKIGWQGAAPSSVFLRAFYAAQRTRLEQRMLFGERRERKRR